MSLCPFVRPGPFFDFKFTSLMFDVGSLKQAGAELGQAQP